MCRPTTCSTCAKTTWAGCGEHVDQVKASVPADQWCTCDRDDAAAPTTNVFSRLFGR